MRTLPTVLTAVLAVAPTLASAQPKKAEHAARLRYGEKGDAPRQVAATPCTGCLVELASATPAKHGTEFILVGREVGTFTGLRVGAHKGRVVVRRVTVELADGTRRRFDVDRVTGGKRDVTNHLGAAREIDRIAVTTETQGNGEYEVFGVFAAPPKSSPD